MGERGRLSPVSTSDLATLIKQAVDITDVIGQVVALRRNGNRYTGLCPFHQEKTPSFHVDSENQFYHCFGCGAGGDVLSFVMKQRGLSFMEAVKYLADRYHIALPQPDQSSSKTAQQADATRKEREALYHVLQIAADFFYHQLQHSQAAKSARDYLQLRGLPAAVVETERLGYAPDRWDALLQHLGRCGVQTELGLKAGLLAKGAQDRLYDRFRNRLIFPIRDEQGRVVAFGGRSLPSSEKDGDSPPGKGYEPKYLNSPETPVYHKGRMLYQYLKAREHCRQQRQVILVEGYLDLLAFHAQGFYRVAATLGTALTLQQVRLLRRIADEVVMAYDSDEAGEKAILRALPLFLQEQLPVSCLSFPVGMDPDDFLRSEGLAAMEALLQKRQDLGAYAIRKVLAGWDGSISGKAKVLAQLEPIFADVAQPVLRSEYVRLVGERLSLPESAVLQHFQAKTGWVGPARSSGSKLPAHTAQQAQSLEESILRAMIRYPELIESVVGTQALENFQSPHLKILTESLLQVARPPYENFNVARVYDTLQDDELRSLFTQFLLESRDLTGAQVHMEDWLKALCGRSSKRRHADLQEALQQAEKEGNSELMRKILAQIQDLCSTKKAFIDSADNA